jgi:hypothetical protein
MRKGAASRFALCLATAAIVAPLLVTRFLPFTDLPEHVAAIATLARLRPDDSTYELSFGRSQYLVYHCVGAILTKILGDAVLANTALLVVVAIATPLSLRAALRAFGRDERLAVFGAMPFLGRPLFVGFLPYVASIPLYFVGIALVARSAGERTSASKIRLAIVTVVLFYTHVSAALVFVSTAFALELVFAARRGPEIPTLPRLFLRLRSLAWLAPTGVAAAVWWFTGKITMGPGSLADDGEIGTMRIGRGLYALPLWTFDVFVAHVDEACAVTWWLALSALALLGLREDHSSDEVLALRLVARVDPSYVPLVCALIAYFVMPFRVGAGGMLNVRLAPIVALTAVLAVRPPRTKATTLAAIGVSAVTLVYAGNAALEIRALARRMDGFDGLLSTMRPHGKLVMLAYDDDRGVTHFHPYPFAGSYYRAVGGDVASYSFSELAHWPIHYRPTVAPPTHTPLWIYRPCDYDNEVDGPYYDYALVQDGFDPFATHRGPVFIEVQRTRQFVLYAKAPLAAWPAATGVNPCPTR